jgi:hypothetical protein
MDVTLRGLRSKTPPRFPERNPLAATDALGVRGRRGQWWLPG